ncbi:hypothetical protein DZ860_21120 [Vibrio sinensis]|uniref:Uncharacterized protein n=1 Tax=Vibrio sinensis TaxID=2302434 RepID=A0A3A6Q681_9VIBR|nr:hypothetical protein [Vibrio sinensis]RJX65863.1 hypothetical protein DZ860_21120 [Vibrio sinensis]
MKTTKQPTFTAQPSMKNKQRGALSAELSMVIGVIVIALIFMVSQAPNYRYKMNEIRFLSQANDIAQATIAWQKARSNFETVSMTKVCEEGSLSKSICGSSNDGIETNPFGGNWSIKVNAGSKGLFDVGATLPQDAHRIPSLANSIASSTRENCDEAAGCSTLATTASTITMTY